MALVFQEYGRSLMPGRRSEQRAAAAELAPERSSKALVEEALGAVGLTIDHCP
jgi:hypothetical protein